MKFYVEKAGGRVVRTTGGSIHWWLFIMNQIPRQYEFVCEAARLFVRLGKNDTSILMKPTFWLSLLVLYFVEPSEFILVRSQIWTFLSIKAVSVTVSGGKCQLANEVFDSICKSFNFSI